MSKIEELFNIAKLDYNESKVFPILIVGRDTSNNTYKAYRCEFNSIALALNSIYNNDVWVEFEAILNLEEEFDVARMR
jgi:hypothetical protein